MTPTKNSKFYFVSKFIILLILLLSSTFLLKAQNTISTDRPSFSAGTYALNPGEVYIELGYDYSFSQQNQAPSIHSVPLTGLRIGVMPNFEISFLWDGLQASSATNGLNFSDALTLGAKYAAVKADRYNISLMGLLTFSGISDNFGLNPLLGLVWDHILSHNLDAFGVVHLAYDNDIFTELAIGIAFSTNDRFGFYTEYFNGVNFNPVAASHNVNIGLTYLISHNSQFDIYAGTGLDQNSRRFAGLGFARAF